MYADRSRTELVSVCDGGGVGCIHVLVVASSRSQYPSIRHNKDAKHIHPKPSEQQTVITKLETRPEERLGTFQERRAFEVSLSKAEKSCEELSFVLVGLGESRQVR